MANYGFPVNTHRYDPYKNFKFRVKWDNKVVAGVSKVSALKRSTEIVKHREGNDLSTDRKAPGRTTFDEVTLERGVSHDHDFEVWANMVHSPEGDGGVSLRNLRKDIRIELLDLQGTVVAAYNLFRCWPSSFTTLPDLDANADATAIETLVLVHEGWERDESITEKPET